MMTTTAGSGAAPAPPSDRARALVEGAYDLHLHVAPDVMRRRATDVEAARGFAEVGMAGFVLKSHYVPTAERASVVRAVVPGVDALGGITLNNSVGGLNPTAVEIAAREGTRVVWLPTVDSRNQRESRATAPEGAAPPMWARIQDELAADGMLGGPVDVVGGGGAVLDATRAVLRLIARHDLVLATGHLGRDEILSVVDAAREEGVRRIVVTHPEFTSQRLPAADQRRLADAGAYLERCFTTPYTGKVAWEEMFANVRAAGVGRSVVSSDLGQPFNPPVEDGMALMADRLLGAGFDDDEVRVMTVENSRLLAAAPTGAPAAAQAAEGRR